MPRISVILSTYNGLPYVKDSVESVLNQSFSDYEFLICDDASTDGTWEFLQGLKDTRVKLFRNEKNRGLFPNLNFLIRQSQASWIHLWSQDDIMYPYCLEEVAKYVEKHPQVPFLFSQRDVIDEHGRIVDKYDKNYTNELISVEHLIRVSVLGGSITGNIANTIVKKSEIIRAGFFNEKYRYSADFDMWERLSRGHKYIGVINKPLIQLRAHTGQLSRQFGMKIYQLRENREILNNWLARIKDRKILKKAKRGIAWKIRPMFFAFGLQMLKKRQWKIAREYFAELNKWENLVFIGLRYLLVKFFKIFKLERKFYYWLFYKNYY